MQKQLQELSDHFTVRRYANAVYILFVDTDKISSM